MVYCLALTTFEQISPRERVDCELFYLAYISQTARDENQRSVDHPRWYELSTSECRLYEILITYFDEAEHSVSMEIVQPRKDKLKNALISK